jgi:hypothetical protein
LSIFNTKAERTVGKLYFISLKNELKRNVSTYLHPFGGEYSKLKIDNYYTDDYITKKKY